MKKINSKLALSKSIVKHLTGAALEGARGGDENAIFTSAIGCPSAFATDCCTIRPTVPCPA